MSCLRVSIYSILPSPYQRDLFAELARCESVKLQVNYLEPSVDDSPWPQKPLRAYERVLSGMDIRWGSSRFHWNWHIPNFSQTDIVILNGYQSSVAQWILRTQAHHIPCIFWGEKMVGSTTGLKGKLQRFFADSLKSCRAIAAIGQGAVMDYQQRYPEQFVVPISYYCDLESFQQKIPERPREPITIIFCGQMIARKGIDLLLKAFERLIERGIQAKLLLVGREAELPQMLAQVSAKTRQWVDYAGFQAPEDLPQFFRQADIFVLPSRYDGWGVVVNQALGAGLPIICSDAVGAAPDLVDGDNGLVFPAGDGEKLYDALYYYVSEPSRIRAASLASERRSPNWLPSVGAERWVNLFQQILSL